MAMTYTITRWRKLIAYHKDGILEIDNNLIENVIRPVTLQRKKLSIRRLSLRCYTSRNDVNILCHVQSE